MKSKKDLARGSGVSQRTISGFENGENISLESLLSLLRVLRLLQNIDLLFPKIKVNPFEVLKLGHTRKRVSSKLKNDDTSWDWKN